MKQMREFCVVVVFFLLAGCASLKQSSALNDFSDAQKKKWTEKTLYHEAELEFWAARLSLESSDLENLRAQWIRYGKDFPESKSIEEIEKNIRQHHVELLAVFMTSPEFADLKDKSLGWTVYPIPTKLIELSENDLVLRTLMPVHNPWARFFLLVYGRENESIQKVLLSNRQGRVEL